MAQVQIVLNQIGAPSHSSSQAREDFVTGVSVQVTLNGGPFLQQQWSFLDRPIDIVGGVQSAAGYVDPTAAATTIQPIDVAGTYLLKVVVDSGQGLGATLLDQATITFYAGPTLAADPTQLPRRVPAFLERLEHNVADATYPGGNTRGWAQEWLRWFALISASAAGGLSPWGRVTLTGGGASLVAGRNVSVVRAGVGLVNVVFVAPLANANYAVVPAARGLVGGSATAYAETTNGFSVARADPFGAAIDSDFTFSVLRA